MAINNTAGAETNNVPSRDDDFLAIVSRIAASSRDINAERQIPPDLANAMAEQGLFRLLAPASVGGREVDFLEYLSITQAIAAADGSAAWSFNQNNVLGSIAAFMPEPLAKAIWNDPLAVVCNGPPQHTTVTPVEGGHTLTGRWNFSSGSRHATWVMCAGRDENEQTRLMFVPKSEVEFFDTWQVSGLRGTGSFSFEVTDQFVPASHSFVEHKVAREPGPLYLIARSLIFASGFASVGLGVARAALDLAIETAVEKIPQEQSALREQSQTHRELGQAAAIWGAANAFLTQTASTLWTGATSTGQIAMDDRIQLRLASTHAIRQAAEVVDMAYAICGATSVFESSPIQRKFQDAHAITQQIQGRLEHYETAGQFYLGLEPQSRMF
jgi:indole-3-acetate monooxygenase